MSDDQEAPPHPASEGPQQTEPVPPPSLPPPPADLGTQDSMAGQPPLDFGEQIIAKGRLTGDLETRIEKIDRGGK